MRLTRFGVHAALFQAAMVAAFYGSPYSNLFFLLLGFLTLTGATGVLAARRNLRGVAPELASATLALPPSAAGLPVTLPFALHAPGRARFDVRVRLCLSSSAELHGRCTCLERRATIELGSPPLARGLYTVAGATLESLHPFGILRVQRPFEASGELVVYPPPHPDFTGKSLIEVQRALLGHSPDGAGDLQPSGLRDHTDRDGTRGIHWRASARRGKLVVQEWEGGSGTGLEVLLDRRCEPMALEESLSILSALVQLARKGKDTLRVHSQGLSATYGDGQRPWAEALRFLALADALPSTAAAPPSVAPTVTRLPRARTLATRHAG